ncbi:monooxygenase 1-like isoform X2 [Papaver somniferum]|uniref:monooxygenase 1-like isoform X2 n=1 Tax=Papaver somniferum TaxID=3469 RepID=UPI000E700514|nr:monooxygenase 1-like isoform X2 [Papaver somniferum]
MSNYTEEKGIVIVGGGICGLATALALHKKGIESVVLEKAETIRAAGSAIGIFTNGWCRDIEFNNPKEQEVPMGNGELRCLKRSDLVQTLADSLPNETIRFGCHIVSAKFDPITSQPLLQLQDGSVIKAKVVIGCDGVNSVISELIGLKPTKLFTSCAVRGFTNYPSGHGFNNEFLRIRKDNIILGRLPVDNNLVHWFVGRPGTTSDIRVSKDPKLIRESTIESINDFPPQCVEMVKNCDLNEVTLTNLRYRTPLDILLGNFRKGTVIVAGDAMHVWGPYIGQGGAAALEDGIVLARNLAQEMCNKRGSTKNGNHVTQARIEKAMDQFVKERRMRLFMMSLNTYILGMLLETSSPLTKFGLIVGLILFFSNSLGHSQHNCGRL